MGPFCMLYWGVDGNWRMIPRMLHLHIFVCACVWLLFMYVCWLGRTSTYAFYWLFMHVYIVVRSCMHTRWLCSLQSGGSISKWRYLVTLSVSDALCSWSGKQQNGQLPEAGTVSGVVPMFPSWTLHVCHAYRDTVCWKSSCQHHTVLDQLSVSLVGLQATLGQSIYSKLASPRVMLHSFRHRYTTKRLMPNTFP